MLRYLLCSSLILLVLCSAASAQRVPWTTSKLQGTPEPPALCRVTPVYPGLTFDRPVEMVAAPDGKSYFVAEQGGRVVQTRASFADSETSLALDVRSFTPDLTDLYGLAFDPQFPARPYVYLCYVLKAGLDDGSKVSRFEVDTTQEAWRFLPETQRVVFTYPSGGHNGGCLTFGLDGNLYISTGDASGPTPPDPLHTGQDCSDLLSSILRIDVHPADPAKTYGIPSDNPFLDVPGVRPEIWAYGFRNPWKISPDPETGALWAGDVGWDLWEMVFYIERGGNYGWSVNEAGRQPIHPGDPHGPNPQISLPTAVHPHSEARSISGGHVYTGESLPSLKGAYVYGDYETGKIWAVRRPVNGSPAHPEELVDTSLRVVAFARRPDGELLVLDYNGPCYLLESNPSATAATITTSFPATLSETGLFADVREHLPAPGVIPYDVTVPMWQDGATAERLVALSGTAVLGGRGRENWEFPEGAVLVKTLSLDRIAGHADSRMRVETQLLHRHQGEWRGYSYLWNEAQTDAELVDSKGATKTITVRDPRFPGGERQQTWRAASRADCLACHTYPNGWVLAADAAHWDTPGQLDRLTAAGLFRNRPRAPRAALVHPHDPNRPLADRARSYLNRNCSHCHRDNGGGVVPLRLEGQASFEDMRALTAPMRGDFGIPEAQILAPGDAWRSVLLFRMAKLGSGRMPHLGSQVADADGLRLLERWIAEMEPTPTSPATDSFPTVDAALSSPEKALAAVSGVRAHRYSSSDRETLLAAAAQLPAGNPVRDLFLPFLPYEPPSEALDPEAVLALAGDADRGAGLLSSKAAICLTCHEAGEGLGRPFGPSFVGLTARRSRTEILLSIFEPSAAIEPAYQGHTLEKTDGELQVGLIVERADDHVSLRDLNLTEHRIETAAIRALTPISVSLMPTGLAQTFSSQELADLLAWLGSLR